METHSRTLMKAVLPFETLSFRQSISKFIFLSVAFSVAAAAAWGTERLGSVYFLTPSPIPSDLILERSRRLNCTVCFRTHTKILVNKQNGDVCLSMR